MKYKSVLEDIFRFWACVIDRNEEVCFGGDSYNHVQSEVASF